MPSDLLVGSPTPAFTDELPAGFSVDFSNLVQVQLATPPTPLPAADATALAVATGDPAAREWAWKRIETARTGVADADELGDMEPSARRSG